MYDKCYFCLDQLPKLKKESTASFFVNFGGAGVQKSRPTLLYSEPKAEAVDTNDYYSSDYEEGNGTNRTTDNNQYYAVSYTHLTLPTILLV